MSENTTHWDTPVNMALNRLEEIEAAVEGLLNADAWGQTDPPLQVISDLQNIEGWALEARKYLQSGPSEKIMTEDKYSGEVLVIMDDGFADTILGLPAGTKWRPVYMYDGDAYCPWCSDPILVAGTDQEGDYYYHTKCLGCGQSWNDINELVKDIVRQQGGEGE